MNILKTRATHASRLERWLGKDETERLSLAVKDWYGPPIAVGNVPGEVWACRGGDFRGPIEAGQWMSVWDFAVDTLRRKARRMARLAPFLVGGLAGVPVAGFASVSDAIAEYTAGKFIEWTINKAGATGVVAVTNSLWGLGNQPAAGANAANAPGGEAPTDATTGALAFTNPTSPDTLHFLRSDITASAINSLILYDRIFQVNKTMNSTSTEAVTGVPSRYQSSTSTDPNYSGGNFLFVEVGGTALAATAHNWTTCLYTDQDGNTGATLPSLTGNSGAIVRRLDHPTSQWFAPLASGDTGIKALTQMQCSAAVATGVINFVMGHAIAFLPCPVANLLIPVDGMRSALKMTRIFDDAALALLEMTKPATTATNYSGTIAALYG